MNFEEAEAKFRQLQARVQRGEPISRAEYEEEVSKLAVQDKNGVLWEINPRTGKWMYFDGAEWVSGAPPGHDTSTVMPVPKRISAQFSPAPTPAPVPAPTQVTRPAAATPPAPAAQTTRPIAPPPPAPTEPPPTWTPPASDAPPPPAPEFAPVSPTEPPPFLRTDTTTPGSRQPSGARPPAGPPPGGAFASQRAQPESAPGGRKEWVPLAIGAVVLLMCAVLLFVGGNLALSAFGPKPVATSTRVVAALATRTNVPTPILLPSPTPIPPTAVPVVAKAPDGCNVRDKPSTKGAVVIKLAKNGQVTLIGAGPTEGANIWYQVNIPDKPKPAWVRSDVIQIVSGDPRTLPQVTDAGVPKAPVAPPPQPTPTVIGVPPPTPKPYPGP